LMFHKYVKGRYLVSPVSVDRMSPLAQAEAERAAREDGRSIPGTLRTRRDHRGRTAKAFLVGTRWAIAADAIRRGSNPTYRTSASTGFAARRPATSSNRLRPDLVPLSAVAAGRALDSRAT